ncbi:rCG20596 [Rattus norvegicus]|uniref:RCG20596 n=1 Tax=Rattus norvegicus TaxID=10116 RepID=A6JDP3_RAT|nr:rCG20596 [Rattus norvegicus]
MKSATGKMPTCSEAMSPWRHSQFSWANSHSSCSNNQSGLKGKVPNV